MGDRGLSGRARNGGALRPMLVAAAAACLAGACLSMSDGPFASGRGEITGRAVVAGSWAAGALVHVIDQPDLPLVHADGEGRFAISGVPAGWREIMLRSPEVDRAYRGEVLVAENRRSDLGEIELLEAGTLRLHVQDGPERTDLDLEDAKVWLREVPDLQAVTDFGGLASLGPLPKEGCYRISAEREPFEFDEDVFCPDKAQWEVQISLSPKKNKNSLFFEIHHALQLIEKYSLEKNCTGGDCRLPEFWTEPRTPPCAWPVAFSSDSVILQNTVEKVRTTGRFTSSPWNTIGCPSVYPAGVCRDQECRFEPANPAEIVEVAKGYCDVSCPAATSMELLSTGELAPLLASLGASATNVPPGIERFLFFRTMASDVPPEPVFFGSGNEARILFFEGAIRSGAGESPTRTGASSWVVVGVLGGGSSPPDGLLGRLAWIRAL